MSRMHVEDGEIGRGRQNESSSSRESSPRQAKKRSFSPTSDDGDLVVPPIADDDTPPPAERPLLRQPVAFAWSGSTSVAAAPAALNTYHATIVLPSANESGDTDFLPGQKVALPPPLPPRRRKKKADGPSKRRKTNDYGGQTTRFRLQPYDPSSSVEPPIQHHSSTSRGVSGTPTASTTSSPPMLMTSYDRDSGLAAFQAPTPELVAGPSKEPQINQRKSKQSAGGTIPSVTKWKVSDPPPQETRWKVTDPPPHEPSRMSLPTSRPSASESPPIPYGSSTYYRRDYESDITLHELESMPSSTHYTARGHLPVPVPSFRESPRTSMSRNLVQPAASSSAHRPDEGVMRVETRRPQKAPLLMLTLLIQDIRSGVTDHQLAEVKLPMKPANDPSEGFWADARLLGQQLQSSASRIDGPAKVYTLRGKYRQFFLRVTAENVDEFISTHLAIKQDRMLDVVVEELLPLGQLPLPPRIPRDLIKSPTPESSSQSPTPERETFHELPSERQQNYERTMRDIEGFRRLPQNFGRTVSTSAHDSPPLGDGGRKPKKAKPQKRTRSADRRSKTPEIAPAAPTSVASVDPSANILPRFDSPDSNDSPEEVHRLVSDAVDQIIQEDAGWTEFFQAKAALQPHRALDVLKQFQFVKRMIDQWAGQRAPFRSFRVNIEPSHITQALRIDDGANFASGCVETLALLELYGPEGRHYEDSRVVEMMNDTSRPEYNAKPIKRLLHMMRDIDKKWKEEHPTESAPSGSGPVGDFRTMRG